MKPNEPEDSTDTEIQTQKSEQEYTQWHIPDVTEAIPEDVSNLFGRRTLQKPITEEPASILPPTLSQIEEIRQEAENEGFSQGKEEGHQAGLEAGRLEGLKQGHEEGFEQGKEQGYQEGIEKALELVKRFEHLVNQFEKPLELLDNEIEQELVSLTLKLARAVVGHEIKTHPEHILTTLRQGVDSLPLKEQGVVIRLHPDDYQLTQELYTANQLEKNRWELESDPSLSHGDCIILSQRSSIDMRLESRMSAVLQELEGHHQNLGQIVEQQKQTLGASSVVNHGEDVEDDLHSNPELNAADTPASADNAPLIDDPINQADDTQVASDDSVEKL
jgi:flagellar assembly protein FliH